MINVYEQAKSSKKGNHMLRDMEMKTQLFPLSWMLPISSSSSHLNRQLSHTTCNGYPTGEIYKSMDLKSGKCAPESSYHYLPDLALSKNIDNVQFRNNSIPNKWIDPYKPMNSELAKYRNIVTLRQSISSVGFKAPTNKIIQRIASEAETNGGKFKATRYEALETKDPEDNVGAFIELEFLPNKLVNGRVGLIQSVSKNGRAPFIDSIKKMPAEPIIPSEAASLPIPRRRRQDPMPIGPLNRMGIGERKLARSDYLIKLGMNRKKPDTSAVDESKEELKSIGTEVTKGSKKYDCMVVGQGPIYGSLRIPGKKSGCMLCDTINPSESYGKWIMAGMAIEGPQKAKIKAMQEQHYTSTSGKIKIIPTKINQTGIRNIDETVPAVLVDAPGFSFSSEASSQEHDFSAEVAAIVLDGEMQGTYLGSIRWGWKFTPGFDKSIPKSAELKPEKIEFLSAGVPSKYFMQAGLRWNRMRPMKDKTGTYKMIHVPLSYERFANGPDDFNRDFSEIVEIPDRLISEMSYEETVVNIRLLLNAAIEKPINIRENILFKMMVLEEKLSQFMKPNANLEQRDKVDDHIKTTQEAKPINEPNENEMADLKKKIAEFYKISEAFSQSRIDSANILLDMLSKVKTKISWDDVKLLLSAFMTMLSKDKNLFSHESIYKELNPLLTNDLALDLFAKFYNYLPSFGITDKELNNIFITSSKSAGSDIICLEKIPKERLIENLRSHFAGKGSAKNCNFSVNWIYYNLIGPYLR